MRIVPENAAVGSVARNAGWLYVRLCVVTVADLIAVRFAMRALGVSGYGVLAAIYGLASATNLFRGVLQETAQRFLCFELGRERGDVRQVFSVALGVSMVFALAVGVFAETAGLWFVRGVMSIPDGMSVTAGRAYHLYVSLHVGRPLIWNENFNL